MKTFLKIIVITFFAAIFGYCIEKALMVIVQIITRTPNDYILISYWGNTFILRIIASAISTFFVGFIVGTAINVRYKIVAIIATLPYLLIWANALYLNYNSIEEISNKMYILPFIIIALTPIMSYFGSIYGFSKQEDFDRSNSILNIRWYNWIWITPVVLSQSLSVLFILFLFIFIGPDAAPNTRNIFITNLPTFIFRFIAVTLFMILGALADYSYNVLTGEKEIKIYRILIVIITCIIFIALYILIFGLPINSLS